MGYRVENALWSSVFAVPGAVVDKHIKSCAEPELKVLFVLLRRGGGAQVQDIAGFLGLPQEDVRAALEHWVRAGVLTASGEAVTLPVTKTRLFREAAPRQTSPAPAVRFSIASKQPFAGAQPDAHPSPSDVDTLITQAAKHVPGSFRRKLTPRQINEMGREDKNVAFLLQESQMILGKPLTPVATDTLTSLYSYYGMNPEVILMLLQYCIADGKDNMRYIEKVAAGWIESGIDTHEKAECEIVKAASRSKLENIIRRLFGISDRALIASEREFIGQWKAQEISVELIELAYERTIEQKGKLSFAYINGILQNWRAKGIAKTEQALEEMRGGRKSEVRGESHSGADEMEQIFKYGDI